MKSQPCPQCNPKPHYQTTYNSRREFLQRVGGGFGMLALSSLLQNECATAATAGFVNPLAPKQPHFPAKAKSVIYLFMHGGPSQIDTFDPKPLLNKLDGQKLPASFGKIDLQFTNAKDAPLLGSRRTFRKHGQSGIEISDLFPSVAQHADDLAVIRSCHHEAFVHSMAMNMMNTGFTRMGFPSMGAWVTYGLGCETQNLPAFVVMLEGGTKAGPPAYGSGFLPAAYQGTVMRTKGSPFLNVQPSMPEHEQKALLGDLKYFNEHHRESREDDSNLAARIAAYELAYRMQTNAPELADLKKETPATLDLYGISEERTREFGLRCLMARRMVERGVRFIQIYSGGLLNGDDWDGHANNDGMHQRMAGRTDKPIAGLLADLKQRGLLDSTLIVWGGDFGRTPVTDGQEMGGVTRYGGGRDHNPYGFSMWMAGGGIRGGKVIGATDDIGFKAVQNPVHAHDIHATILGLMGLDHEKLTYLFQGRNFRLTDVHGENNIAARLLAM